MNNLQSHAAVPTAVLSAHLPVLTETCLQFSAYSTILRNLRLTLCNFGKQESEPLAHMRHCF